MLYVTSIDPESIVTTLDPEVKEAAAEVLSLLKSTFPPMIGSAV